MNIRDWIRERKRIREISKRYRIVRNCRYFVIEDLVEKKRVSEPGNPLYALQFETKRQAKNWTLNVLCGDFTEEQIYQIYLRMMGLRDKPVDLLDRTA